MPGEPNILLQDTHTDGTRLGRAAQQLSNDIFTSGLARAFDGLAAGR